MPPLRQLRRSRRLSHRSPVEAVDYDWQSAASHGLLHTSGSDVAITSSTVHLPPPSPSACTSPSSASPPSFVTHLPFAPGSSHTRNRKEGHIPRPPNAFMVFRSWLWNKDNLKNIERDNRNVSRIAGRYWNELSEAERAPFRCMAEEAKARHAQLYPQYRYSPTSQKKPKVSQRRSQRSTDTENEKCKKVADMLLGGVTGRDLAKYLDEGKRKLQPEEDGFTLAAEERSLSTIPRNTFKRPVVPRGESPPPQWRSKKQEALPPFPLVPTPPFQYAASLPILPATEDGSETAPTSGPLTRTPELAYPLNDVEGFVATDDIPYLSLDSCNDFMLRSNEDDSDSLPSHLKPGMHTIFSGVRPEATSFVDSCVLGAYTTSVPAPVPFTDFEIESYSSLDSALAPLGSPVFSNPFEPSTPTAGHPALLGTLDQLFGQSISPLTPIF